MKQLLIIGCGKMSSALLGGWERTLPHDTHYILVNPSEPRLQPRNSSWHHSVDALPADLVADIIVLGVKPQKMDGVLAALTAHPAFAAQLRTALFLSVAAGKRTDYFAAQLGEVALVRTMPNTPALIGEGMTGLYANNHTSHAQRTQAEQLMQAVGHTAWLDDEVQMDAFTATAGSGPAYLFHFIEALTEAAAEVGLPEKIAQQAAIQTIYGAAKLAAQAEDSPTQLRENVTSPGGTTAAALDVLMQNNTGFRPLLKHALAQATKRAKEL